MSTRAEFFQSMYPGLSDGEVIDELIKASIYGFEHGPEVVTISAAEGIHYVPYDAAMQKKSPYWEGTYKACNIPFTDFQIRYQPEQVRIVDGKRILEDTAFLCRKDNDHFLILPSIYEKLDLDDWLLAHLLFDDVNTQVGNIAQQVGTKPSSFEPRVFAMIEALSRNVVLPIAGIILTFIACYELIEMITQHNNMAQFEPALLMKWIFKTAISVWMISNTFDIIMAVFDVTQQVVANSSGIISGNTRVNDIGLSILQSSMMSMDVGPLFGLFLQSFFIGITMRILSIVIFVIVYGRMIEIYMMVSLAPVPMATWGNHEQSHVGQNYLRSLFALGFQGFLILICVAIYAVLLQNVAISGDAINSIWSIVGYTVLLCFTLFKTGSVARSILGAH